MGSRQESSIWFLLLTWDALIPAPRRRCWAGWWIVKAETRNLSRTCKLGCQQCLSKMCKPQYQLWLYGAWKRKEEMCRVMHTNTRKTKINQQMTLRRSFWWWRDPESVFLWASFRTVRRGTLLSGFCLQYLLKKKYYWLRQEEHTGRKLGDLVNRDK